MRFSLALTLACGVALTSVAQADTVLASSGTKLYAVTQEQISSKTNHDGDKFTMVLKDGFFHHNPASLVGATVDAHVENDMPASHTHKASMTVVIDDLRTADGKTIALPAKLQSLKTFQPHTHHIRDAGFVIGGAIAGHAMGSHHGMKHGGLAGAAAGFALASALKSDIVVRRNTQVELKLTSDLTDAPAPSAQ